MVEILELIQLLWQGNLTHFPNIQFQRTAKGATEQQRYADWNPMKALNFLILVALVIGASIAAAQETKETLQEDPSAVKSLGYSSVAEALEALKAKKEVVVTVSKPDGWTIVNQKNPFAIWSFTPPGHYAYPAVVRRTIVQRDGAVTVEMAALCQADKVSCDRLIREFNELNQKMKQSVQQRIRSNQEDK